ncbi:MAG: hypothetical protein EOO52_19465 [Gammaproteobacteria bacterium]|nr:MAG: hypothetical protein EOO52_19465 [Gammaproteobacteria bacterium]
MKHLSLIVLMLCSVQCYAAKPDFTEKEVVDILRNAFPQDKGDITVQYLPNEDQWLFRFHIKGSHPPPGLDRNGTVDDDRQNPKIFQMMEG